MLKPQKKKFNKKDLKKDPLLDSVMKAQTFYESNKNKISYGITGLIVIVLLFVWVTALMNENAQKANTILGKAQVELDNFNTTKAKTFLSELDDEYPDSEAAIQAHFLMANIKYREKNYSDAKVLFQNFVDSFSGNEVILASGYAGLAACFEMEKNYLSAAEAYLEASKISGELSQTPEYLYLAGLNFQKSGNENKAVEVYQEIVDNYTTSSKNYDAQAKLILATKK